MASGFESLHRDGMVAAGLVIMDEDGGGSTLKQEYELQPGRQESVEITLNIGKEVE